MFLTELSLVYAREASFTNDILVNFKAFTTFRIIHLNRRKRLRVVLRLRQVEIALISLQRLWADIFLTLSILDKMVLLDDLSNSFKVLVKAFRNLAKAV